MRVITCEHGPELLVVVLSTVTVGLALQQASNAVGSSKLQLEPHSTVLLGAQVKTGAVVSATVTTWLQLALLLQQSVTCQARVITCEQPAPLVLVPRIVTVTLAQQARKTP